MALTRRAFVRTLFAASQAGLAGRLLADSPPMGKDYSGALNFGVVGDWGRQGRPDQVQVAQQMGVTCALAKPSFIISVGDNFYENGIATVDDKQWQTSFENVYTGAALQVPWHVALGNHDYRGNVQAQIDYAKAHPRWNMPARYYSRVHAIDAATPMDFFYIDTSPMMHEYQADAGMHAIHTQDVPKQLHWLEAGLAASKAPWKIVVGHHPIYSAGLGHGSEEDMIRLILPLLQKYKVQAYFSGHDHDLQHLKAGDVHLIISGGGSEHRPVLSIFESEFGRSVSGFVLASARAQELQVRFFDDQGSLLHTAMIPRTT